MAKGRVKYVLLPGSKVLLGQSVGIEARQGLSTWSSCPAGSGGDRGTPGLRGELKQVRLRRIHSYSPCVYSSD